MRSRDGSPAHDGPAYGIGETARRFGLAVHVLRHWEDVGLLSPARDTAGCRRYDDLDRLRIALILQGKELSFSLDKIRAVLSADDPAERRAELHRQHTELLRRIEHADRARQMISHALDCPSDDFLDCPHMRRALLDRIPPAQRATAR